MRHDFQINETDNLIQTRRKAPETGLAGLLMKIGLVKNKNQAKVFMIIFIIVGLALIIYINLKTFA